jgi:lantibiotic modifying enzyme
MIESTIYMARLMFRDLIEDYTPESLERFANDFKNLEELFQEQMKQSYLQGWEDRWHVDRTDLSKAFEDFYKTYKK